MLAETQRVTAITETDNSGFYSGDSTAYDKQRWESPGGIFTNSAQQDIVNALTNDWHSHDVVEVGPGTARFTIPMAGKSNRVTVVDIAPGMLDVARRNVEAAGQGDAVKAYVEGSIYALPFADSTFDHAISLNVFNHLERVGDAIRQLARVTRPGGTILFNYANLNSYYYLTARRINKTSTAVGQAVYSRWITNASVTRMIADAGLTLEKRVGHVHMPRAMEQHNLLPAVNLLDALSRTGCFRPLAPIQYCYCRKPAE